jgi:hypothetical protein
MVAGATRPTRGLTVNRAQPQEHDASKRHPLAAAGGPKQLTGRPPRAAFTGGHEGQVPVARSPVSACSTSADPQRARRGAAPSPLICAADCLADLGRVADQIGGDARLAEPDAGHRTWARP